MNAVNQKFYDRIQGIPADKLQIQDEHGCTYEEFILLDTYMHVLFYETKPVTTDTEKIDVGHIIELSDGGYAYVDLV
ncbi:hypothetical protein CN918_30255 [Priestia megaterium]|nr:hypothetical protein CN918_30255 [Priestia megaterium]